jgi:hypothetical protein
MPIVYCVVPCVAYDTAHNQAHTRPMQQQHLNCTHTYTSQVFLVREKVGGDIYAMKVLRKDNIIKRNQVNSSSATVHTMYTQLWCSSSAIISTDTSY